MTPSVPVRRAIVAGILLALARTLPGAWSDPAAYALIGVLPGLAAADLALPRAGALARLAAGLAAGPLLASLGGAALMRAGMTAAGAAPWLAAGAALAWVLASRAPRGDAPADEDTPRALWGLAAGLAVAVALPPLLNPYIAVRGDTWTHGAIVMRVVEGGLPPEDPRFAAITVRYVWFYNLFLALLAGLRGQPPFGFMIALNAITAFATVALLGLAALALWRRKEAGVGAAALAIVGFNAAAWLLWPMRLGLALTGDVLGPAAVAQQLGTIEWGSARIIYSLSAPLAHMTSMLDKLLVGSPLAYAYLLMTLHLWAVARWLERGEARLLPWMALAAAGTMLFHGVVALSVIPVWVGALVLALLLRWRAPWLPATRLAAAAGATLAGALAGAPYLLSIARDWSPERSGLRHQYLAPDPWMAWTIATACGVVLALAAGPLRAVWRERHPAAAVCSIYLGGMILFACVVRLPQENQMKFAYEVFVPAAALAAPAFGGWLSSARRGGTRAAVAALVLIVPVALTLHGYLADPGRDPVMRTHPGEADLERFVRERTPAAAVLVDRGYRDLLMVRGRRALYLGTDKGPDWAAFPADQIAERRRVTAALYDGGDGVRASAATLARFGRPVYVVFRPEDDGSTAGAWEAVRRAPDLYEVVYEAGGYRVARVVPGGGT